MHACMQTVHRRGRRHCCMSQSVPRKGAGRPQRQIRFGAYPGAAGSRQQPLGDRSTHGTRGGKKSFARRRRRLVHSCAKTRGPRLLLETPAAAMSERERASGQWPVRKTAENPASCQRVPDRYPEMHAKDTRLSDVRCQRLERVPVPRRAWFLIAPEAGLHWTQQRVINSLRASVLSARRSKRRPCISARRRHPTHSHHSRMHACMLACLLACPCACDRGTEGTNLALASWKLDKGSSQQHPFKPPS